MNILHKLDTISCINAMFEIPNLRTKVKNKNNYHTVGTVLQNSTEKW